MTGARSPQAVGGPWDNGRTNYTKRPLGGAANTVDPRGLANAAKERRLMPIVHGSDSIGTPPPDSVFAARMARIDGCPEACGNTEPPRGLIHGRDRFRALYLCATCGCEWSTEWRDG